MLTIAAGTRGIGIDAWQWPHDAVEEASMPALTDVEPRMIPVSAACVPTIAPSGQWRRASLALLLMLVAAGLQAGDAPPPVLRHSQAVTLAKKVLAQPDPAKREALLAASPDGPVGAKEVAAFTRLLLGAPAAAKALKPGIHDDLTLAVPPAIADKPVEYSLYVPSKHDPKAPYALIIGLHGGGQNKGSGKQHMASTVGIQQCDTLYACPTSVDLDIKRYWRNERNEAMFAALIAELARIYPIDRDRIYLTGYSMGGMGSYVLGARMVSTFAAVAPGGGSWSGIYWPAYRNTPLYIWHGKKDMRGKQFTDLPNAETADQILTELGFAHQLRLMECGHPDVPPGEPPLMLAWLLKQKRTPLAKRITMASPCTRDFMGETPPSPRNHWLLIDEIGPAKQDMDGVELGGTPRIKRSMPMGTLDATWAAPNRLEVTAVNVKKFRVFLAHGLVDAAKPLTVLVNGTAAYEGAVPKSAKYLIQWLADQGDGDFPCIGELPIDVVAAPAAAPGAEPTK